MLSCSLGACGLPTKKSDRIYGLPWNYSFLRRTLKRGSCCDCPDQIIGIYWLEPTNYSCTCVHGAVFRSCGRKIWVLYCAHTPNGRLLRPVPWLASKFPRETFIVGVCAGKIMSPSCVRDFLFDYRAYCSGPRASWSKESTTTDGRKWTSTHQRTIHRIPIMTQ